MKEKKPVDGGRQKYARLLAIDPLALDEAVSQHAQHFFEIAEQATNATDDRDGAKMALEETEAKVSSRIRKALSGSKKATEKLISEEVSKSKEYQQAQQDYLAAKTEADHWWNLKQAFEHRASMLKRLVDLYVANYYSSDSASRPRIDKKSYDDNRRTIKESRQTKEKSV